MVAVRYSANLVSNGQMNKQIIQREQELKFKFGNQEVALCIEQLVELVGGLNGLGKIRCLPDHVGVVGPVGSQNPIKTAVDYRIEVLSIQDNVKIDTAKIIFMGLSDDDIEDDDDGAQDDFDFDGQSENIKSGMIQAESHAPEYSMTVTG